MHFLHVISCGVYRNAEKYVQRIRSQWINLTISGIMKSKTYYPDGTLCEITRPGEMFMALGFPDFCFDFEFGTERENWVMMFDLPEFQYDPQKHRLFLQTDSEQIPLQQKIPITAEEILEIRERFAEITRYSGSALEADRLRADFAAASLFQRFLPEENASDSIADHLRQRLDQDREHRYSIKEHCYRLGMSPNYLRKIFTEEFGISPCVYRERRQKNDLLSLFTYSPLTVTLKEIADRLGLKHVQHLNLLTERYFHCTPRELSRRCRKILFPADEKTTRTAQKK